MTDKPEKDPTLRCARCGGPPVHMLPLDRDGLAIGALCETCWRPNLVALRSRIAGDTTAAMGAAAEIAVWLRTAGVRDTGLDEARPPRELLPVVRELLDELAASADCRLGPRAMCSACFGLVAQRAVTIIPYWNEDLANFVTTFRCPTCLPASIAETRYRVADPARPDDVVRVCEFLKRHSILVHEYLRGDPADRLRPLVVALLDQLAARTMVIEMGETVPVPVMPSPPAAKA